MTHRDFLILGFALLSGTLALLLWRELRRRSPSPPERRILFPFDESTFAAGALEATLRIAKAENAVLMPTFLAIVPLRIALEAALPRRADIAIPLLDRIETKATRAGVAVDSRIEPGRSHRHALRRALGRERFDRVVIAAESSGRCGFASDDVAWMLDNADIELLVLKAGRGEEVLAGGT